MISDLGFLNLHFDAAHPAFKRVVERFRTMEKKSCIAEACSSGRPLLSTPFGLKTDMIITVFLFGCDGSPDLAGDMYHTILYCKYFVWIVVQAYRRLGGVLLIIIAHHVGRPHITIPCFKILSIKKILPSRVLRLGRRK